MNTTPDDRDQEGPADFLTIALGVMVVLALVVAGVLFFGLRSVAVVAPGAGGQTAAPATSGAVAKNAQATESPFADEPAPPAQPVPPPTPPNISTFSEPQLAENAKLAVLKKLNIPATSDSVAWADPEFTKNADGTLTVSGVLTADGMSRKWSCRLKAELVAGAAALVAADVSVE